MIAYKYLSKPLKVDNGIHHLVLENKVLYRKTLTALFDKNGEDWFVVSEKYNPVVFNKKVFFISNVLLFGIIDKKVMAKIQSDLAEKANDLFFEELSNLRMTINEFAEKLSFEFDFDFVFDEEIDTMSIIKMLNFRVENDGEMYLESMIQMFRVLQKYAGIKLFICYNLSAYFSMEEIKEISAMARAADLMILNIENSISSGIEKASVSFIDKDLCEIVDN